MDCKGKVLPRIGHEDLEGEYSYSSILSLTLELDEGWVVETPRLFNPGKDPVPIVFEMGWGSGPLWTGAENLPPPPGFGPRTVQSVGSRYTDYSISVHGWTVKERIYRHQLKTGIPFDRIWNIKPLVSKCRQNAFSQTSFGSCCMPREYIPQPEIHCLLRTILQVISHLRVDLQSGLFPARFPTKSVYAFLLSPLCSIRHTERICDLVNLMTFENHEARLYAIVSCFWSLAPHFSNTVSCIFPQCERWDLQTNM